MSAGRAAYSGTKRRLVVAMDIGTTFSGISYSILDPGQIPGIKGVTRFPAQETSSGASKIPTVIYYDRDGEVRAVGAETNCDEIFEAAEENQWVRVEWFKLHLRSKYGDGRQIIEQIPPLPLNKTVVEVFSDFLKYMLFCAKEYIKETHMDGLQLWTSLENEIDFVLSHPNGWEGTEQAQMRRAAVLAGLVPDTPEGHARISFVTEGEANLHFAIENGVLGDAMEKSEGIVIVDAGGGTVDISTYRRNDQKGETIFEEISPAQCHFHGSVFVSINARVFLQNLLAESQFKEDLDRIVQCFDKTTKPRFRNAKEPQHVRFGSTRDNDHEVGIRFGQLKISGSDVAPFFQPSVSCVVDAVKRVREDSKHKIQHVLLVGGFSASDWLYKKVQEELDPFGFSVTRPESPVNKAVSDGAASFYLDHYVRTRVSKMIYGTTCARNFDSYNPDHVRRDYKSFSSLSGEKVVPDVFSIILPKDTQVSETKEFRRSYSRLGESTSEFSTLTFLIQCYRGSNPLPEWMDEDTDNYSKVCTVTTDLSKVPLSPSLGANGTFYRIDLDIILLFGLTEFKAQVAWKENGVEKRGPATIVYEP